MSLPPPLQLNTVTYVPGENDAWSLGLGWTATQPATTAYWVQMQVFDSPTLGTAVGQPVTTTAPGVAGGAWSPASAQATLSATAMYWIAVRAVNAAENPTSLGAWSYPLPLLLSPPKLGGVRFEGTSADVLWIPPAGAGPISTYVAFVLDASGTALGIVDAQGQGYPAGKGQDGARYLRFDLSAAPLQLAQAPLAFALAAAYRDSNTGGISYGPADQAGLFTAQPLVASAVYRVDGQTQGLIYRVTVADRGYDGDPAFLVALYADETPVWETSLATTRDDQGRPTGYVEIPHTIPFYAVSRSLAPGVAYSLSLARVDGVSVGPFGPRSPVPAWAPELTSVEWDAAASQVIVGVEYPAGDPRLGAARIQVTTGNVMQYGAAVGRKGVVPISLQETGDAYVVVASTQAGESVGPPSAAVTVLMDAPQLTGASFDGRVVRATWAAVDPASAPGIAGIHLGVTSGAREVAGVTVSPSATSAVVEVGRGGESLEVRARIVGDVARGPWSSALSVVESTPSTMGAQTDPVTGQTTLTWSPVEDAAWYWLQFYREGDPVGAEVSVNEPTYVLPVALLPNVPQSVAGAVTIDEGEGMYSRGPFSPQYPLPSAQPAGVEVELDGRTLTVSWQAAAGASGYRVSVLEADAAEPVAQVTAAPGATEVSFDVTLADPSRTYSVVVQALVDGNSGPPTAPVSLFVPGYAVSTQPASTAYPHLWPTASLSTDPWDIVIHLPAVCGGTVTSGPFTLAQATGAYPCTLTISAESDAWTFDASPVRTGLRTEYVNFLKAVEAAGGSPASISLLQEVISRVMPQTFPETLYYAYGLDLSAGVADLRPGMVLRVATASWLTPPGTPVPAYLSGYTGGAVVDYEVGSYAGAGGWAVGLDAFLATLAAGGALQVPAPLASVPEQEQEGAAEAADLFYPAFQQPFYRLFVPSPLSSASAIGSAYTPDDFVISAAASYTSLTTSVQYPASGNAVAWFRGRAVLKPCIRVWVNGAPQVVPIGTTVGNLLDAAAQRVSPGARMPAGMRLLRSLGRAVLDASSGLPAGLTYPVRLASGTLPDYGQGADSLALPLLHGDRLTLPR